MLPCIYKDYNRANRAYSTKVGPKGTPGILEYSHDIQKITQIFNIISTNQWTVRVSTHEQYGLNKTLTTAIQYSWQHEQGMGITLQILKDYTCPMPWLVNSRSNVHENAVPWCMPYSHILTIRHVGMSLINYQQFVSIRSKIPLKIPAKPTSKDEDFDIPKHPCCSRKASTNPPKWWRKHTKRKGTSCWKTRWNAGLCVFCTTWF